MAIVLLLALLPYFAVKTFHYHPSPNACTTTNHHNAGTSGDGCLLCQFSLVPFLKGAAPHWQALSLTYATPTSPDVVTVWLQTPCRFSLRAPPVTI